MARAPQPRPTPYAGNRSNLSRQFSSGAVPTAAESFAVGSVPDKFRRAVDQFFESMGGQNEILASAATTRSVFSKANIVGAGIGRKHTAGDSTDTMAVQVFVVRKLPLSDLAAELQVPKFIKVGNENIPTDVIETGEIVPMPAPAQDFIDVIHAQAVGFYTDRYRPAPGGSTIGHPLVTAGTLGCLVSRNDGLYILSNNHVLAAVNSAKKGDRIWQPGKIDGGTSADAIAIIDSVNDIIRLKFNPGDINDVDATLALTNDQLVTPEMHDGIALDDPTPLDAVMDMQVQKVGRTTGPTQGQVKSVTARIRVKYDGGRFGQFQNQIMIESLDGSPFSQGGDSGSLIMSVNPAQPVALLFAGSDQQTFATPIQTVMDAFGGFDIIAAWGS